MAGGFYKYKFVLTGGGTGGHIMPLVAMREYLQQYPVDILYVGESGGREEQIAQLDNITFRGIFAGKMRRYNDLQSIIYNILDIFKIGVGIVQAIMILEKFKPDAILSKGGYVSLPVCIAGGLLKIPILIHESDMEMGLTNKMCARFAKTIATGFPVENYQKVEGIELVCTGTPVERDFFSSSPGQSDYDFFGFDKRKPVILVTGGIQGSHKINMEIKKILPKLLKKWQVIHLCGEGDYPDLVEYKDSLKDHKRAYAVFAFLSKERIAAMRIANLVVSRASATTLAELAVMGKPLILIPLPTAAADHQSKNASVFESGGAALIIAENQLTDDNLYETIRSLEDDKERLLVMGKASGKFGKPEAGKLIVEQLLKMIHE